VPEHGRDGRGTSQVPASPRYRRSIDNEAYSRQWVRLAVSDS